MKRALLFQPIQGESSIDLTDDLGNESRDNSDYESTDRTPRKIETFASNKENLDDETLLETPPKTMLEAMVEQSNVKKPVEIREPNGPVQDQPEKETSTHERIETIQDGLVDQMVSTC